MSRWAAVADLLRAEATAGCASFQLLAPSPFYDETDLPFTLHGGGVLRIVPEPGFRKESLAGSQDERAVIVECPDAEGWLVPEEVVAAWMARNVSCPGLEDILVTHPLFEDLTRPDEKGRSRGGRRGGLVQWLPGIPEVVLVRGPELLPGDDVPEVNRDRSAYADAFVDLLDALDDAFSLQEVEVTLRVEPA